MPIHTSLEQQQTVPAFRHFQPTAAPVRTSLSYSSSNSALKSINVASRSISSSTTDGSPVQIVNEADVMLNGAEGFDTDFMGSIHVTGGTGEITFTARLLVEGTVIFTRSITSSAATIYTSILPQGVRPRLVGDVIVDIEVTANARTACTLTLYDLLILPVNLTP